MPLNAEIDTKLRQAANLRLTERRPSTDPRLSYEAGVTAAQLEREAKAMTEQRDGNNELICELQKLINYLESSPRKSSHRTLALRHLEDAQSRLMRENG